MTSVNQHTSPLLTNERRSIIAKIVAQDGTVRVSKLAQRFDVHAATIRRDLDAMENEGILERVYGGATAVNATDSQPAAPETPQRRIGQAVGEMITDGETVFLNPGQITFEVARWLTTHSRLTIVTNSLEIAHWVAANTAHTLIVTGGQAEGRDTGLVGQLTQAALSNLRADHVVLELSGISAVDGLTKDSLSQAEITRLLLELGSQIIVLIPPKRVGQVAAAYVAPISDVDIVVTAREAPSHSLWDLSEAGVKIVLA